ncbi:hypothetical protein AVEN_131507-1 [Araneus ventricosus]|uniref:Bromo domain-containing protein n=1 Tax=Araneus ventricosus TaxID=182803 RepID=A0A4Y2NWB5_ARAVE|nr:hypothetical protein AVEN_89-1 [Araneus ventricosus]GBN42590.1 hypothetical protein AVEN_131507-1 [Araneus ventricosus]
MRNIPFHFASGTHATTPVDAKVLHLPDYNQVIKHPLHLGTIKKKLYNHEYKTQKNLLAIDLSSDSSSDSGSEVSEEEREKRLKVPQEQLEKVTEQKCINCRNREER